MLSLILDHGLDEQKAPECSNERLRYHENEDRRSGFIISIKPFECALCFDQMVKLRLRARRLY